MGVNHRIATIIIAGVTIIGAIFNSSNLFVYKEQILYLSNRQLYRALIVTCDIISLISACCLYNVISIDDTVNRSKKKFLLPFIIWESLQCVGKFIVLLFYIFKYGNEMDHISYLIKGLTSLTLLIFVLVELSYYKVLRGKTFDPQQYAQTGGKQKATLTPKMTRYVFQENEKMVQFV